MGWCWTDILEEGLLESGAGCLSELPESAWLLSKRQEVIGKDIKKKSLKGEPFPLHMLTREYSEGNNLK